MQLPKGSLLACCLVCFFRVHLPGPRIVTVSAESENWENHSFPAQEQTPPLLAALKLQEHLPARTPECGLETPMCLGKPDGTLRSKKEKREGRKRRINTILHNYVQHLLRK